MTARTTVPLLLALPILERMRGIEGWLSDEEGDLLIAGLTRALTDLPAPHVVVEVGSYCGRSTSVLGSVLKTLQAEGTLYAIDPHDGEVGARDHGIVRTRPTFAEFTHNMSDAGLSEVVTTVRAHSYEVHWERRISFLLVDGLHDYANVSRDFGHFERWLREGAFAAFHGYADYYPGVMSFVDELLPGDRYAEVMRLASMILLRRRRADAESEPTPGITVPAPLGLTIEPP